MTDSFLADLPCPCRSRLPALALLLVALAQPGRADQTDTAALQRCATLQDPLSRLTCYDTLAGRADAPAPPVAPMQDAKATSRPPSEMSHYWELDPQDKHGVLKFVGYRPNYILPLHYTSRINRSPQSPTQAAVAMPDYQRVEAKFQLSLRTKLIEDTLQSGVDVWAGFTQQALWQVWNGKDSAPFRNTDYEPEVMLVMPTHTGLRDLPLGWQWRYTQLALIHQSNGQSDPLSRSWNRVYLAAGFEHGPWGLTVRFNQRLNEPLATDNNPDLVALRGRGEARLQWSTRQDTASLQMIGTPWRSGMGSLQLEWTHAIDRSQPDGLRWYVQAFSGYSETLTDYNFRQNSIGVGVSFVRF